MPTGLTQDAGWNIGVSRTLPQPPEAVWEFIASPEGVALWLGEGAVLPRAPKKGDTYETKTGVGGEVRGYHPGTRIRVTYGRTTVQVTVSSAPHGRTVINFHQERMSSAEEREVQRGHWAAVMDEAEGRLG
ncbi:SRPBCC family protein [Streptomyces sp. 2A115]|uniref:SRPBCC family protein n=1 Tax=Streptomyces sp. 2A115 TaxID=3457439 RepID=UPI003FD1A9E2